MLDLVTKKPFQKTYLWECIVYIMNNSNQYPFNLDYSNINYSEED